ncbi:MAG: MMPL family transporter [Pirellulaceae bacterium]|nr:MMPL family transporter [Pirellulaceae bacterium]
MSHRTEKSIGVVAKVIVDTRWYLLALGIALSAIAFMLKGGVQFDNSIEGMFAPDNKALLEYRQLKKKFGGTEIALAVYDDPDLFDGSGIGLNRLRNRANELQKVAGVLGVLSLAEINDALKAVYLVGRFLGEKPREPVLDAEDPMAVAFLDVFEGYTHAADRRTVAIVCLLESAESATIPRANTIKQLRKVVKPWDRSRVTGEPVLLADGFMFIRRDGKRLNLICLILISAVIVFCFRSIRWVIIPVAVIQMSLWLTLAALALLGWKLTMVSSMLSAIIAVISVATVIHITVRYREARLIGRHPRTASMKLVFDSLLLPITWTCVTTAAGFFALTIADVKPVSDFGWMMAFGSLFVLLSVIMLVPGMALLGDIDTDPQTTWGEDWLEKRLRRSSRLIQRFPLQILLSITVLMGCICSGLFFLKVETDFTKNFREDSEIIQAYTFVEKRMGGAGLLDVVIQSPPALTRSFLGKVEVVQDKLRTLTLTDANGVIRPALSHIVSFADASRITGTNPVIAMSSPELRFRAMVGVMPGFAAQMKTLTADDQGKHYFRIMLRTSQRQTAEEQAELIENVKSIVSESFPQGDDLENPQTMTTGFFVLLSDVVNSVIADQVKTFFAACLFIGIVMLLAFGSLRLVLIALIPNVLPILGLLGLLGWLGIRMNMGAAMIAAVSLGLSIDGTIHYLTGYRANKRHGMRTAKAIDRVQFRTGRALIYATFALVIGFGSLCISEFIPTVFFGGLVGLSMLGGMLGNLVVLPTLLILLDSGSEKRKAGDRASRSDQSPSDVSGLDDNLEAGDVDTLPPNLEQ